MKSFIKILDQGALAIFLLLAVDTLGVIAAFLLGYFVRNDLIGPAIQPFEVYQKAIPVVLGILVVTFYTFGLYERRHRVTQISELYNLIRAITLVWVLVMAASFLSKYDYSRLLVVLFFGFSLLTINLGRYVLRVVYRFLYKKGIGITRVLIIGAGRPGRQLAEKLKSYETFGYSIVGFIDDHTKHHAEKIMGRTDQLLELLQTHNIQEIFVADPSISHERIMELIHQCEQTPVKFKVVSDLFEIVTGDIDLNELEGLPSLDLRKSRANALFRFFKRGLDVLLSLIGLLVFFPFGVLVALAIRLDSPGGIFFVHERVGKDGKIFRMVKFRTMKATAGANEHAPQNEKDNRITRVGRWLRKTSLDEVPQFWNVLTGEMSMVGPRPEMPFIVAQYTDWQKRRLEVKPGITGLWQILGRKDLPLHENIEYDFYYIKNQSLLLDFVILLKTIAVVLRGKGAY